MLCGQPSNQTATFKMCHWYCCHQFAEQCAKAESFATYMAVHQTVASYPLNKQPSNQMIKCLPTHGRQSFSTCMIRWSSINKESTIVQWCAGGNDRRWYCCPQFVEQCAKAESLATYMAVHQNCCLIPNKQTAIHSDNQMLAHAWQRVFCHIYDQRSSNQTIRCLPMHQLW